MRCRRPNREIPSFRIVYNVCPASEQQMLAIARRWSTGRRSCCSTSRWRVWRRSSSRTCRRAQGGSCVGFRRRCPRARARTHRVPGRSGIAKRRFARFGVGEPTIETLLLELDLIGTFVFALSGATAGVKHRLDLFGVRVLSYAAGNVGGIARDLLIGAVPPTATSDWRYLAVSRPAPLSMRHRTNPLAREGSKRQGSCQPPDR